MNDVITKLISDVTINVNIKQMSLGSTVADLVIATKGTDDKSDFKLYYNTDEIGEDFGGDSMVFKKASAAFAQDKFYGPIAVLTYPATDQEIEIPNPHTDYSTVSTPTADGANVELKETTTSTETVSGIVAGLQNYLWLGWRYLILDNDDDMDNLKAAMHYLNANQHGILVASVSSIENLQALHDEAISLVKPNYMDNTVVVVNKNEGEYHDVAAAAFASLHIPLDWMHIRDLNGVTANTWTYNEFNKIASLNGTTSINKSGDIMMSGSRTVAGNYVDNTFGVQYTYDNLQNGIQRFLNSQDLLPYDDNGINLLAANAEGVMATIAKQGLFTVGADGKPIYAVEKVGRTNTSNVDVVKRRYNGLTISCQLVSAIETVNLKLNVTL